MEARNVIPLTAECHRRSCRGNTTEQFKSVWMKFNPHSSPPPICRLIYSQVHSAAVSEEAADSEPGERKSICDDTFDRCSQWAQWLYIGPAHFHGALWNLTPIRGKLKLHRSGSFFFFFSLELSFSVVLRN